LTGSHAKGKKTVREITADDGEKEKQGLSNGRLHAAVANRQREEKQIDQHYGSVHGGKPKEFRMPIMA
jgi:hypothetical protein